MNESNKPRYTKKFIVLAVSLFLIETIIRLSLFILHWYLLFVAFYYPIVAILTQANYSVFTLLEWSLTYILLSSAVMLVIWLSKLPKVLQYSIMYQTLRAFEDGKKRRHVSKNYEYSTEDEG